ncbi:serine protease [Mycobacterium sp.]|uniref:serine protease n=1 Tax=Mycobacterium sp. TaxID=1785 RepID=UPI0025D56280|nr:serine protease [Mycobacterium sp.]
MLADPPAAAEDKLPFGGGAGIIVDGSYCTLTTIGHDRAGELVGFTAASCGGSGAQVVAEGAEDHGSLGTVATVDDDLDYAVITFDSSKVVPVADFDGFVINGIGPDPGYLQPVCTRGGATGFGCGFIKFGGVKPAIVATDMPAWQPGDDGAPLTVDDQLVGMTREGFTIVAGVVPKVITHVTLTLFSAILDDVNSNGGPGAGFTPIGS